MCAQMGRDIFGHLAGHGGQRIGDARPCGRARQMAFGIGPDQPRHADGRNADGQGVGFAQKLCCQIGGKFTMQDRGVEQHLVQGNAVARLGGFGAGAAVQIFPDEFRVSGAGRGALDR